MMDDGKICAVHCKKEPYDVYIGSPLKWGNPFNIGREGSRQDVIHNYKDTIIVNSSTGSRYQEYC